MEGEPFIGEIDQGSRRFSAHSRPHRVARHKGAHVLSVISIRWFVSSGRLQEICHLTSNDREHPYFLNELFESLRVFDSMLPHNLNRAVASIAEQERRLTWATGASERPRLHRHHRQV